MRKNILTTLFAAISLCNSAQQIENHKIQWPQEYEPSKSRFFVHNEIEIEAPPQTVWKYLIDALEWPNWYAGAQKVSYKNPSDQMLDNNVTFLWKTMGLQFESTIMQFDAFRLLAWESKKKSIQGYHVWLLIPGPSGCKVITEESQNGWLTRLEKTFQKNKLRKLHDVWLSELKSKAEQNN